MNEPHKVTLKSPSYPVIEVETDTREEALLLQAHLVARRNELSKDRILQQTTISVEPIKKGQGY